jgi:hypothetical protein
MIASRRPFRKCICRVKRAMAKGSEVGWVLWVKWKKHINQGLEFPLCCWVAISYVRSEYNTNRRRSELEIECTPVEEWRARGAWYRDLLRFNTLVACFRTPKSLLTSPGCPSNIYEMDSCARFIRPRDRDSHVCQWITSNSF